MQENIHKKYRRGMEGKTTTISSMDYIYGIEILGPLDYNILYKKPNDDDANDEFKRRKKKN